MTETIQVTVESPTATRPIEVPEGCDLRLPLHLQVIDTAGVTQNFSATDCTWTLNISDYPGGTVKLTGGLVTVWADTGVKVETAASGFIHLIAQVSDLATLTAGTTYWYDLTVTTPAGHAYLPSWTGMLLTGSFTVTTAA